MSNIILAEVKTGLEKLKEITDPVVLSSLMDEWNMFKKIGEELEKKVKDITAQKGTCGDYYYETQNGNRQFKDAAQAELIALEHVSAATINDCKKLGLGDLETAYVESLCLKFGCSKKEAKQAFGDHFAGVIEQTQKRVLTRRQLKLQDAMNTAAIDSRF